MSERNKKSAKEVLLSEEFLVPVIGIIIAILVWYFMPEFEGQAMNLVAKYMLPLSIAVVALCVRFTKPSQNATSGGMGRYFLKDGKCKITKKYCNGGCKQCIFAAAYIQGASVEDILFPQNRD